MTFPAIRYRVKIQLIARASLEHQVHLTVNLIRVTRRAEVSGHSMTTLVLHPVVPEVHHFPSHSMLTWAPRHQVQPAQVMINTARCWIRQHSIQVAVTLWLDHIQAVRFISSTFIFLSSRKVPAFPKQLSFVTSPRKIQCKLHAVSLSQCVVLSAQIQTVRRSSSAPGTWFMIR